MNGSTGNLADILPSTVATLGVSSAPDALRLREQLGNVHRIAVLLIDGLGYHLLPEAAKVAPTLAQVVDGRLGTLRQLSCAFPSTTPVSLATLGTGALPGAHGILGFTLNVPGTDRVLTHIAWSDDPDPRQWQPLPTVFETAHAAGLRTAVVARPDFEGSGLSRAAYGEVSYVGAARSSDLAARVLQELSAGPGLVYGYYPSLDAVSHVFGIDSDPWRGAATSVDRMIARIVAEMPEDAALLVTADHGALDVPASARIDMDADPRLSAGVRVVAGEPRVRYLHTVDGAREDVIANWRAVLGARATVLSRDEAIGAGLFGPVSPAHVTRIGDVVAICQGSAVILATAHEPESVSKLVAFHGSTSAVETAIPLICLHRT